MKLFVFLNECSPHLITPFLCASLLPLLLIAVASCRHQPRRGINGAWLLASTSHHSVTKVLIKHTTSFQRRQAIINLRAIVCTPTSRWKDVTLKKEWKWVFSVSTYAPSLRRCKTFQSGSLYKNAVQTQVGAVFFLPHGLFVFLLLPALLSTMPAAAFRQNFAGDESNKCLSLLS